jgi:hypothetical protein
VIWIVDIAGDDVDLTVDRSDRCGRIPEFVFCSRSDDDVIALA